MIFLNKHRIVVDSQQPGQQYKNINSAIEIVVVGNC